MATTGATADEHLLAEVLWQHRRLSRLGVPAVVADAKYGTTTNFLYLGQLGIPTFIPSTRSGNMRKHIWCREYFQWLPEEDAYRCPAGQKLRRFTNLRSTAAFSTERPKAVVGPVPSVPSVPPREEKEPFIAPGRSSLSRLRRTGSPAPWVNGGCESGKSMSRGPSPWGKSSMACGRRASRGDAGFRFSCGSRRRR